MALRGARRSKQPATQENLVSKGRVTTATPAELDFIPSAMGGDEGCADAMSAGSRVSMVRELNAFNGAREHAIPKP